MKIIIITKYVFTIYTLHCLVFRAKSFTSLMPELHQENLFYLAGALEIETFTLRSQDIGTLTKWEQ